LNSKTATVVEQVLRLIEIKRNWHAEKLMVSNLKTV